jgi:hypothetical protein
MMCRQTDYRLTLEQIAHLLAETLGSLSHHSYGDLVRLLAEVERLAHEILYSDPATPPA